MVINPETPLASTEHFLDQLDVLLIMAIHPGFQGQEFIPETIDKIKKADQLRSRDNLNFKIEVDGGVSLDNARDLVDAGVDYLVMGSHLLKGNIEENLEHIWEKLEA